jgi:hypothetical protein
MQSFIEKRRVELEQKVVSIENSIIYSGECAFVYTFEINGIKNLFSLLHLINPTKPKHRKSILKLTNNKEQS